MIKVVLFENAQLCLVLLVVIVALHVLLLVHEVFNIFVGQDGGNALLLDDLGNAFAYMERRGGGVLAEERTMEVEGGFKVIFLIH